MDLRCRLLNLLVSFTFLTPVICIAQSPVDLDGHKYTIAKIGEQEWMGQNLNVSKFSNGDPIQEAKTDEEWEKASIDKKPVWTYYERSTENGSVYGKLYNWFAVNDPRGLAPKGWHIPSEEEWKVLTAFLGDENLAGKKLKEKGTTHWRSPNTGASNESGFTALPGGLNYSFASFVKLSSTGYWWTVTEDGDDTAILYSLGYDTDAFSNLFLNKGVGLSVRCVKD